MRETTRLSLRGVRWLPVWVLCVVSCVAVGGSRVPVSASVQRPPGAEGEGQGHSLTAAPWFAEKIRDGFVSPVEAPEPGEPPRAEERAGATARGDWCLGNDEETDPRGDAGPDLIWFRVFGPCFGEANLDMQVRTVRPAAIIEFVFDTDLNGSTGCDGADLVVVVTQGRGGLVDTPSCDEDGWVLLDSRSVSSNLDDWNQTSVSFGDLRLFNSSWYVVVADEGGTGVDSSWTTFYSSTTKMACGSTPSPDPGGEDGYWLTGVDGSVWSFGDAPDLGHSCRSGFGMGMITDFESVDVDGEATWVALHADGEIVAGHTLRVPYVPPPWEIGALRAVALLPREAAWPWLYDYWVVYDNGTVIPASHEPGVPWFGDMRDTELNQPIIDAVAAPDGQGYWLVGLDGGVFSFGSARFYGSMGGVPLNQPVVGMVPDPDGVGYWLVAADGGVFAFRAPFRGSVPGVLAPWVYLSEPVVGMITYGNGYLMLASDGGVFAFSDREFAGSLGDAPPDVPIAGVAAT